MKPLLSFLGLLADWLGSVLLFPVHLKNFLVWRAIESKLHERQVAANERMTDIQVLMALRGLPAANRTKLPDFILERLHASYGLRESETTGTLVPLEKKQ